MNEDFKKKIIYMDYAASTPLDREVFEAMNPFWSEDFGNPNSLHQMGRRAKAAVETARKTVSEILGCKTQEVIFTGSGTESNNIALQGVVLAWWKENNTKPHIITTAIEHSSVENVFKEIERGGLAEVSFCSVDSDGLILISEFKKMIRPETVLVSVMYVNNEIGTIQPIKEISQIIKSRGGDVRPLLHVDAAQAPLYLPLDVSLLGVDLMSLDGQKVYGPKGVGALFVRFGTKIRPLMFGGKQEMNLRPATQSPALISGLAKALSLAEERRSTESSRLREIQKYFLDRIEKEIKGIVINGSKDLEKRNPNNINISIDGFEGDFILTALDERGICASSVSACHSGNTSGSHVVGAISGNDKGRALGAVRFTMGRDTSKEDVDAVIDSLKEITS